MITGQATSNTYQGDGSNRVWNISFEFTDSSQIKLRVNGKGITTNYSIDIVNKTVTYPTVESELEPLNSSQEITIYRETPITQDIDFINGGPLNAEMIEDGLDKLTQILQEGTNMNIEGFKIVSEVDENSTNEEVVGAKAIYELINDTQTSTSELKNKTIDADDNTIKDLTTSNFKSGVIQTSVRDSETATDTNLVTEKAVRTELDTKQDILTFDEEPTENSDNPVTSGGVYEALSKAGGASLFDTKILTEPTVQKNWCCIGDSSQKKLNKSAIPTAYEFLKDKFDSCDMEYTQWATLSDPINLMYWDDGYWYFVNYQNGGLYRNTTLSTTGAEQVISSVDASTTYLFKATINKGTYYVYGYAYNDIAHGFVVLDSSYNEVYRTNTISGIENRIKGYYVLQTQNKIVMLDYNGQNICVLNIGDSITVDIVSVGFTNGGVGNWVLYNGNYYLSTTTKYKSFSPDNPYQLSAETVFDSEGDQNPYYAQRCTGYLTIFNNKLTVISFGTEGYYGGDAWHITGVRNKVFSLNESTWTKIYDDNTTNEGGLNGVVNNNGLQYLLTGIGVQTTSDFVNYTNIYNTYPISYLYINPSNEIYAYSYSGYRLSSSAQRKKYTDTINGTAIKYFKSGVWKICTPDIAVGNDTNLQTVFEYLGYLNYWWIDINNEQITLQRNSNMWTMMYVGDDYEDDSLPSGQYKAGLKKIVLSEAPTTSTVGSVGDICIDTTNGDVYICTGISGSTYTWSQISIS